MEFIFQIEFVWFPCLLGSKFSILNLFISRGSFVFQIWVPDQSGNGFVYFYWLFQHQLFSHKWHFDRVYWLLSENFTKLLEKFFKTTYFINKIEKLASTGRRLPSKWRRQLNKLRFNKNGRCQYCFLRSRISWEASWIFKLSHNYGWGWCWHLG